MSANQRRAPRAQIGLPLRVAVADQPASEAVEVIDISRCGVFYIAADQAIEMVRAVTKAVGEDEFPVQMEPVNAPLAGSVTGADGWARYDLFLPNELLIAGKNVAMKLMAAQQAPPAAQPPAEAGSKAPEKP